MANLLLLESFRPLWPGTRRGVWVSRGPSGTALQPIERRQPTRCRNHERPDTRLPLPHRVRRKEKTLPQWALAADRGPR